MIWALAGWCRVTKTALDVNTDGRGRWTYGDRDLFKHAYAFTSVNERDILRRRNDHGT